MGERYLKIILIHLIKDSVSKIYKELLGLNKKTTQLKNGQKFLSSPKKIGEWLISP